jgi:hypothetical protein
MKTYITLIFNSDGSLPSEIRNHLLNLGFKATKGNYDFVYEWGNNPASIEDLIWFADKVHTTLKNCKVNFTIESI